jgi:hypothetical protein
MRTQRLNNHPLKLALAALTLVALAAVACNGDDSSPADGSPSSNASPSPDGSPTAAVTPIITPGTGEVAVGSLIEVNGLDGHRLDTSRVADCPAEAIQTVVAGTPTIESRLALNQFCIAAKDFEFDKAITVIVDLPDTGEVWEMELEFDADLALWKVQDVKKVSG